MKKSIGYLGLMCILGVCHLQAQEKNVNFGLKAGANYARFSPNAEVRQLSDLQYKRKVGFYMGGFMNIELSNRVKLQPEVQLAVQGTKELIEDIGLFTGEDFIVDDFRSRFTETTIILPIVVQYYASDHFYLLAGPQLGIILDTKQKIIRDPFSELNGTTLDLNSVDTLDFGGTAGVGYKITNHIGVNINYFFSVVERNNGIKSSVFNLGLEYQF